MTAPQNEQAAQTGLAIITARALQPVWPALDIHDLQRTTPQFTQLVHAVVNKYAAASATLATHAYTAARREHVPGRFTVIPASPPDLQHVSASVDWAVSGLYGPEPDEAAFQQRITGAAQKLVQDTGRQTIIDNVSRDKHASGWARVPETAPCYFCAMLASRGAVYKAEKTADFRTHDNCRCHPEAVFTAYEPSAQIREWQALYRDNAPGPGGMKAAQLRFRRAYEGRTAPVAAHA